MSTKPAITNVTVDAEALRLLRCYEDMLDHVFEDALLDKVFHDGDGFVAPFYTKQRNEVRACISLMLSKLEEAGP